jgi:Flavin containing amine oxidoreductase
MNSQTPNYDIIIVGGGIAGLYTAYKALKRNSNRKILILEKNKLRLGGRIYSYSGPDISITVEHGAGRFHRGHRHLINLLGELQLEDHIVPAKRVDEPPFLERLLDKITFLYDSRKDDQDLDHSFCNYVIKHGLVTQDEFTYIVDNYGYSTELFHMNIRDMMILMKDMRSHDFLGLRGGLSQVIDKLEKAILTMGGEIRRGVQVTDIDRVSQEGFLVHVFKKPVAISCRICVLAIPKSGLLRLPILNSIRSRLNTVHTSPLCRIYATYDQDRDGKVWFENLKKTPANNRLRLVIPSSTKDGVIMISYTDDKYAKWWYHIWKDGGKPAVKRELTQLVAQEFPWAGSPLPKRAHIAYWEEGVGYWKPGVKDSGQIAREIARPFGSRVKMYICGENYAPRQQWMESALSTCPQL